jgi:hypothetical protein
MKYKSQPPASIKYMNFFIYTVSLLKNLKDMSDFADKYSEEIALGENTMIDLFLNGIGNLCIVLLAVIGIVVLHKLNNKQIRKHQESMEYYLYKISRVTGHSEYDVFCKSAEDWPVAKVSKEKIDADFKNYLGRNAVPPYVNHFVRQNKHHIDELHLPRI